MTSEQKQNIIRIKENYNWTWDYIGIAVNESSDTVRKYFNSFELEKEIGAKPKLPKKRLLGDIDAIKVHKKQIDNPRMSLRKMSAWIRDELIIDMSHTAVKDFFDQRDFIATEAIRRPILREANIIKRLNFAKTFFDDVDFIRNVLWSDETIVSCYPNPQDSQRCEKQNGGFCSQAAG